MLLCCLTVLQRAAQANHTQTIGTHPATEVNQSPSYTTPLSSKTELRSARDHHVVDVRQQNTVAAPTQWADADKTSKTQTSRLPIIFLQHWILKYHSIALWLFEKCSFFFS